MKKIVLLLVCLSFYMIGQAQVSKTVNVTAGGLSTALTSTELATVTNLTITGTINDLDFVTMRDNMPALAVVDISAVTIAAYNGTLGTLWLSSYPGLSSSYPANTIPDYSFYNPNTGNTKTTLTSFIIPLSVTSIGNRAFYGCRGLTSISIPSLVTSIEDYAFMDCNRLGSIYAYPTTPVNLTSSPNVFYGINMACTLYVPKGSLSAYQAAKPWSATFANIVEMTTTAVATATVQPLFVYPNPVTDGFFIKGLKEKGTLSLFDINGKMLLTKPVSDNEYIPISTIPKGLYIVKITTAAGTMEQKVVKE